MTMISMGARNVQMMDELSRMFWPRSAALRGPERSGTSVPPKTNP
jgi:hypothetical protein